MKAREQSPVKFDPTAPLLRQFPGTLGMDRSNTWIYIGSIQGVRKARLRKGSLICPLDIDPLAYQWPVKGLGITVITDDDKHDKAVRLAQALIRDGASMVHCGSRDGWTHFCKQHESNDETIQ